MLAVENVLALIISIAIFIALASYSHDALEFVGRVVHNLLMVP